MNNRERLSMMFYRTVLWKAIGVDFKINISMQVEYRGRSLVIQKWNIEADTRCNNKLNK